ncbi:hypothetical protein CTheo_6823 [Ceratobasidium theobromae]|uniref:Uncharacterized protein n=1 Tax=Ceratobasidium theobromae TaxID=1582974 RepID=A0A5N5QE55_9AGAM|nr:hypothetical protein CTheo_6823 [Ceratobasidium theobromae]
MQPKHNFKSELARLSGNHLGGKLSAHTLLASIMNAHSIRHAWFPPAIPKRKYERDGDGEIDVESEWPGAYRALSAGGGGGPGTGTARPAKRLRALEGGLAGLSLKTPTPTPTPIAPTPTTTTTTRVHVEPIKINTSPSVVSTSSNQIHNAPLEGEIELYISSIYEWASPHTAPASAGIGSSVDSLPLCGEVSEVNTSDESDGGRSNEQRSRKGRMGEGVFVHAEQGMPGYTVYEPEWGPEKRKREQTEDEDDKDDTHPEKKGKRTWYEPEKDRIVILDLDSSEDESVNRSPRRRRSAFSLSSLAPGSPVTRPRSHTEAQPEYVINHTLLAHISPPGTREGGGVVSIPREEDPSKAVVLYKPAPWVGSSPEREGNTADESEAAPMEASPLIRDDDAMDIDM